MEGGAFDKADSDRCGPLRSLSVAKKKILTSLRLTPITIRFSVRDQIGSCPRSAPLELSVQWELNFSKTHQKSPMHKIIQILGNVLKKFEKVNTKFAKNLVRRKIT